MEDSTSEVKTRKTIVKNKLFFSAIRGLEKQNNQDLKRDPYQGFKISEKLDNDKRTISEISTSDKRNSTDQAKNLEHYDNISKDPSKPNSHSRQTFYQNDPVKDYNDHYNDPRHCGSRNSFENHVNSRHNHAESRTYQPHNRLNSKLSNNDISHMNKQENFKYRSNSKSDYTPFKSFDKNNSEQRSNFKHSFRNTNDINSNYSQNSRFSKSKPHGNFPKDFSNSAPLKKHYPKVQFDENLDGIWEDNSDDIKKENDDGIWEDNYDDPKKENDDGIWEVNYDDTKKENDDGIWEYNDDDTKKENDDGIWDYNDDDTKKENDDGIWEDNDDDIKKENDGILDFENKNTKIHRQRICSVDKTSRRKNIKITCKFSESDSISEIPHSSPSDRPNSSASSTVNSSVSDTLNSPISDIPNFSVSDVPNNSVSTISLTNTSSSAPLKNFDKSNSEQHSNFKYFSRNTKDINFNRSQNSRFSKGKPDGNFPKVFCNSAPLKKQYPKVQCDKNLDGIWEDTSDDTKKENYDGIWRDNCDDIKKGNDDGIWGDNSDDTKKGNDDGIWEDYDDDTKKGNDYGIWNFEKENTKINSTTKNVKRTCKFFESDSISEIPHSSPLGIANSSISDTLISPISDMPNFLVSDVPNNSVPTLSLINTSSSQISSAFNTSSDLSSLSVSEVNPNLLPSIISPNVNEQIEKLKSDNFIPAPKICEANILDPSCSVEENQASYQDNDSECEVSVSPPDPEHYQMISNFITGIVKERSVKISVADKVTYDLNRLFKYHSQGNVIEYYGSFLSDLAITTSDINLVILTDVSARKSFMGEIYKLLSSELEKYHVHEFEEGTTPHKCKINFIDPDSGINCSLAYLGKRKENYFKMAKFLKSMCYIDERAKNLIIAAKVWAEQLNINEVEDGKLHSIGFALLVVHFLQHCENPILPLLSPEEKVLDFDKTYYNDSCIGSLWLDFLRYYSSVFNWQQDIVTVTSADRVPKTSKKWENYWIAIEDPYTGRNIAESIINKDVADYIKSCFKTTYHYFLNGPEIMYCSSESDENQSGAECNTPHLEFSFNDCIVGQDETFCEICDELGDVCEECKKKIYVQPMTSVPKMTDSFLKIIKDALLTVYNKYILTEEEVKERRAFVNKLQYDVCKIYPGAKMRLFGSSVNGFGFKKSDLDICLMVNSQKEVLPSSILKDLRRLLRRNNDFENVVAIFNAKIPILKFRYKPRGWHGDISLSNVLAIHNSELLYTYSIIDERCKILGCALKLMAKKALIAEVTEKALSSYSYLIMVIHFLQQTDPPVLPVLQDNQFREKFELDDIVEDCNVWFCKDQSAIEKSFKVVNEMPVEQLFLDLLDYYCSLDCNKVITIRQKETFYLSDELRTARLFNIQDPFLVTKNLGCVVSPTKAQETRSVFNRARMLFRTPKDEQPTNLEDYFFSTMSLTGKIQKEVLCDFCGKFGHDEKECKGAFSPFQRNNFFNKPFYKKKTFGNQTSFLERKQMYRNPNGTKASNA